MLFLFGEGQIVWRVAHAVNDCAAEAACFLAGLSMLFCDHCTNVQRGPSWKTNGCAGPEGLAGQTCCCELIADGAQSAADWRAWCRPKAAGGAAGGGRRELLSESCARTETLKTAQGAAHLAQSRRRKHERGPGLILGVLRVGRYPSLPL